MSLSGFFSAEEDLSGAQGFEWFGAEHLTVLAGCALLTAALCLVCRFAGVRARTRMRVAIGTAILLCEAARIVYRVATGTMSVYFLPLHLCGLAVFFCFFHSLRPSETVGNLIYGTFMPGALCALLMPDWTLYPIWCFRSLLSFFVHALIIAYPLALVCGGDLRPNVRRLPGCFAILLCCAVPVYAFDRVFSANYMYLLQPLDGTPLSLFASLLGNPGYLLGYLPMLAVVWLALYLPFMRRRRGE